MLVTKLTFIFSSPIGPCYGNQLIVGAVCRRLNWPCLLFALVFHNELQYRNVSAQINSGNDVATSCKNYVKFGQVTSEITRIKFEIFVKTGQKGGQKSAYFTEYLSTCWSDLHQNFSFSRYMYVNYKVDIVFDDRTLFGTLWPSKTDMNISISILAC